LPRSVKTEFSDSKTRGTPIGPHVRTLRKARSMTLAQLSERSGVSVAMLSKLERDERIPSVVITWRIAEALGVPLSRLLGIDEAKEVIVIPKKRRKVFRDPATGFERHILSPIFPTRGLEFLLGVLPSKGRSGLVPAHQKSVEEYVVAARGVLIVIVGDKRYRLEEGDAIYYDASVDHEFFNPTRRKCEFYIAINSTRIGW
jgi:transcriptional regulator with XRE-family HTH domain